MTPNRSRPGTSSRKSSSRLAAISLCWSDRPVTLPPGRAKLATKPLPTGSVATANTMGMTDVACFAGMTAAPNVTMTSTFKRTKSVASSAKRSLRPSVQRYSIAKVRPSREVQGTARTLGLDDPAQFAQSLHKSGGPLTLGRRCIRAQEPDGRQLRGLLRACDERPRSCTTEQRDERAAVHSITSSARASSIGGISRPTALAVLRLIKSSNLVGNAWR